MLLMIDNYDSFTYNLVQYFGMLDVNVSVYKNDELTLSDFKDMAPSSLCISPGPCTPKEAGVSIDLIKHFHGKIPILGVCLGHQCIGAAFGANIVNASKIMHGKTSMIKHKGEKLFAGIENPMQVTRYHSLLIANGSLQSDWQIDAQCDDDGYSSIMAISHKDFPTFGIQFHPESIATEHGLSLLRNFINSHG